MFPDLKKIHRPKDLAEAFRILAESDGRVLPLAGGSAKGIWDRPGIAEVMDLWGLPMNLVEETRRTVRLGSTVTIAAMLASPAAQIWDGALAECAGSIGSTQIRNLVTVGGNLCAPYPWVDLPVILLVLDALVEIRKSDERKMVPIAEFLLGPPRKILEGKRLVTSVEFMRKEPGAGAAFQTLKETHFDYALVSVGAALKIEKGKVVWSRISVGAVESKPRRVKEAEIVLDGAVPGPDAWSLAGKAAGQAISPTTDSRVSKDYKREMVGVLVERALEAAYNRAVSEVGS